MFISKRKHNIIVAELNATIAYLEKQCELKEILEKLSEKTAATGINFGMGLDFCDGTLSVNLPNNVPIYVDDMLGGKVIKQEATKVLKISKNGNVTTGLTKQKPDKGFKYKLIRD